MSDLVPLPPPRDDSRDGIMSLGDSGSRFVSRNGVDETRGLDEVLEIRRLLWVLFERKWQILFVASLIVIAAAVATFRAERLYRSIAMVQIDPEPIQVLPYRDVDLPPYRPNYEVFVKSQEQILKGSTLVSRIAQRLTSDPDAEQYAAEIPRLRGRLAFQRLPDTQIMLLGYVSPVPETAAKVANLYAEEYLKLHFEGRQATRESARELLQRELSALEQKVQQSEKQLVEYAQSHGIPVAATNEGLLQQRLSMLTTQLADVEAEVHDARARLDTIRRSSARDFPQRLATPLISELTSRIVQLENELTVLRTRFGENWPDVVQKRSEITLARERLDREQAAILGQAVEQATTDFQSAETRRRTVAAAMTQNQQLLQQLETASVQYNIIQREVDTTRRMYEGMLERLKQTSVTTGMELGGFQVLEPATPSNQPDTPRPFRDLTIAGLLGLSLGICVAFARDFWNRAITTVEDVERFTALPTLGVLPRVPSLDVSRHRPGRYWQRALGRVRTTLLPETTVVDVARNRSGRYWQQALGLVRTLTLPIPAAPLVPGTCRLMTDPAAAEGARSICASLLLSRSYRPPRVLLITSPVANEGKSTVAHALGQTLAESGSRTLLIECDMRRPTFEKTFGIGTEGGLSLYLAGHAGSSPTIHSTATDNLFVVAAGVVPPNPPALLNSRKLRDFLSDSISKYDFIILDGPPALPVADARILALLAEGVVMVVRAGFTSRDAVRRARSSLDAVGANVLGVAFNDTDRRNPLTSYTYGDVYYAGA